MAQDGPILPQDSPKPAQDPHRGKAKWPKMALIRPKMSPKLPQLGASLLVRFIKAMALPWKIDIFHCTSQPHRPNQPNQTKPNQTTPKTAEDAPRDGAR